MAAPSLDGTNTYNTTGTALTDHTIPLPTTGMAAGKRIVVFFGMSGSQTTTITSTDPDWTFYGSGDALYSCNAVSGLRLATKVAGAGETNPTFTMSQTVHGAVISSVWGHANGTPTIDEVAAYDNGDVGSQGSIPAPSVTTLGADRAVVRAADMNGSLAITYAASTAQASCISSGTVRQTSFGVLNQAVAGATGTETISGGNATWVATTIAIAPPDVAPPAPDPVSRTFSVTYGGL